jgi:hypothetical protein
MGRPARIPDPGDVPPSTVAQRLGLGDFKLRLERIVGRNGGHGVTS